MIQNIQNLAKYFSSLISCLKTADFCTITSSICVTEEDNVAYALPKYLLTHTNMTDTGMAVCAIIKSGSLSQTIGVHPSLLNSEDINAISLSLLDAFLKNSSW